MSNPPIPSIPPLSSIADPNTRAVLQALITGWQVRNGQAGDGGNKFITSADVGVTISNTFNNYANGSNASSVQGTDNPVSSVVKAVSRYLQNTPEWNTLNDAVAIIQTPDWMRQALANAAGDTFSQVSVLAARLNEASAAIGYQDQALVTTKQSLVTSFKQLISIYGGNTAGVTNLDTALTTLTTAQASHVNQTTAAITTAQGTATAAITHTDDVKNRVDGTMSAMYTLSVQTTQGNGTPYVAGMSFGVNTNSRGNSTSNVVFRSDTFAIGMPGATPGGYVVPFTVATRATTVDGVVYPAGTTFMSNVVATSATIGDGAITNAKIGNVIYSSNYVAGVSGWQIRKDGSAEFNGGVVLNSGVTINGNITSAALQNSLSKIGVVVQGSVTLSTLGGSAAVVVPHGLGRPALINLIFTQGTFNGEYAYVSANTSSGFTISMGNAILGSSLGVGYVYL